MYMEGSRIPGSSVDAAAECPNEGKQPLARGTSVVFVAAFSFCSSKRRTQVRGFIASFTTVTPSALAFDRCTACSAPVVAAHRTQGFAFVEKACLSPQVLEEVSGLEEMRQ